MAVVITDLISGSTAMRTTTGKNTQVRKLLVTGVTTTANANRRPFIAMDESGITENDPHPFYTDLFVTSMSAAPASPGSVEKWIVTVNYAVPDEGTQNENTGSTIVFNGAVGIVMTTQYYLAGVLTTMEVGTLDRDEEPDPADAPTTVPKQTGMVNKMQPQLIISAQRRETSNPAAKIRDNVGFLNSSSVTLGGASFPAGTLFCTRISGHTDDNEQSYVVDYEFQYRISWKAEIAAIDPDTGSPYQNLDNIADGSKKFEIYDTVNFNLLNL